MMSGTGQIAGADGVVLSMDPWVNHAIREAAKDGVILTPKYKTLHKFGTNGLVGTSEATVMTLPAGVLRETYATTNAIDSISSSDAGDTGTVYIEGNTVDGSGNFTFVTQTATLTGQTKLTLGTPLARVTRLVNTSAATWAGSVYIYQSGAITGGVPNTAADVHLIGPAGENQSQKAATTISSVDYCLITNFYASVNKKTAAGAVVRLRVRDKGQSFRTLYKRGCNSLGPDMVMQFGPYQVIKWNSDIEVTAAADAANTEISGGFNSILMNAAYA
jgi:hypothetical protein